MSNKTIYFILVFTLCMVFGRFQNSIAASSIAILPAGDGIYVLQGTGVEGAAAMDIIVSYDPATLASPQVTQGALISGAMIAVNDTVPGKVRMGIVRTTPVKGSGILATLTFNRTGDAPGNILGLKVILSNINGKSLPVLTQITQQGNTTADASGFTSDKMGQANAGSGPAVSGTPPVIAAGPAGGVDVMKGPVAEQSSGTGTAIDQAAVTQSASLSADSRGITAAADHSGKKIQEFESVLKKFKKHKGARTPKALIALFTEGEIIGFRQEPPVAIADGTTPVRVSFISAAGEKTAADIAVIGAKVISMKKDPDYTNTWLVELLPAKGAYKASLAVSEQGLKRIYPLTIAPKVDIGLEKEGGLTDKNLGLFLNGKKRDVTKDGKKNYIDDYIIVANYLFATNKKQAAVKNN